jgi:hypothetical protein
MFEQAISAGIKPRHVAKILDISRVTASQWLNNHTLPHPLLRSRVKLLLDSVSKAVVDSKLPAPAHFRGREENNYICDTLHSYMTTQDKM